jgi:hypothetical protein
MYTVIRSNKAKTAIINNVLYNTEEIVNTRKYLFGIRIFKTVFNAEVNHQSHSITDNKVGFKKDSLSNK